MLSVFLSCAGSPVSSKFCGSHWESMANKQRKLHHTSEEGSEDKGEPSGNMQALMELLLERQAKSDADRVEADRRAETLRREEKVADEARADAKKVADEEREENRRIAAEVRAKERAEARAEAKRQRKLEEARVVEDLERAREEAARVASERLRDQQEAASTWAYEQQVALIKLQEEIGKRAADAHRLEVSGTRKRERGRWLAFLIIKRRKMLKTSC